MISYSFRRRALVKLAFIGLKAVSEFVYVISRDIQSITSIAKVVVSKIGNAWNLNAAGDAIIVNAEFIIQVEKPKPMHLYNGVMCHFFS